MHEMTLGEKGSVFIGRSSGEVALIASSYGRAQADGLIRYLGSRRLTTAPPIEGLVFWDSSSMLVCIGCSDASGSGSGSHTWSITVPAGGEPLASSLFVDIAEFNPEACTWNPTERRRLLGDLQIRVELKPGAWRVFKVAPATKQPASQTSAKA